MEESVRATLCDELSEMVWTNAKTKQKLETLERIEALVPKPHYSKRVEIINELLAAGLLAALTACLNAATSVPLKRQAVKVLEKVVGDVLHSALVVPGLGLVAELLKLQRRAASSKELAGKAFTVLHRIIAPELGPNHHFYGRGRRQLSMSFRPGLTVLESVLEFVAADADVHHNFLEQIVQMIYNFSYSSDAQQMEQLNALHQTLSKAVERMLKATAQSRSLDFIGHVVETHLRLTCCTGGGGPADEPAEQQLSEAASLLQHPFSHSIVELRKNATFTFSDQLFSILLAAVAAKTPTPSADDTKAKTSAKKMVQLLNELLLAPVTREHAATVLVTVLEKCDCPSTYQYSTVQQKPAQALMCLQLFDQLHLDQLLRANLNSNLCPVGEGASSSVQLMRQLTLAAWHIMRGLDVDQPHSRGREHFSSTFPSLAGDNNQQQQQIYYAVVGVEEPEPKKRKTTTTSAAANNTEADATFRVASAMLSVLAEGVMQRRPTATTDFKVLVNSTLVVLYATRYIIADGGRHGGVGAGEEEESGAKKRHYQQLCLISIHQLLGKLAEGAMSTTCAYCQAYRQKVAAAATAAAPGGYGYLYFESSACRCPLHGLCKQLTIFLGCDKHVRRQGQYHHPPNMNMPVPPSLEKKRRPKADEQCRAGVVSHYRSLIDDRASSDFVIRCCCSPRHQRPSAEAAAGDDGNQQQLTTEIAVHRMILGARSAYFRAMLFDHQGRTVEARQGYVEVVDFDAVVVRALVEFIYTGTVKCLEDGDSDQQATTAMLFEAADKYGLDDLKNLCEERLAHSVTVPAFFELCSFAQRWQAQTLMGALACFLATNAEAIFATNNEWWLPTAQREDNVRALLGTLLWTA